MRFSTDIRLSPSTSICNDEIALVDILLCYHGDNRNGSRMSKETINKAIPTLYGIPIIGEYIYLDDGSQDFGSHGGKITISDKGIKFESTTIPYGFVTKEAVDNAEWVTITEKDGHTKHEYLSLKGCAVWHKRMPEVSSVLDNNYGQSMEIKINDYLYDDNGIMDITDFTFTGACILGSNPDGSEVIPCYESACIGRHYELDTIKNDIKEMMNAYNKFQIKKKEENSMDFSKVTEALAQYTYKNADDTDVAKYALLTVGETSVGVLDREDYSTYSIDCTEADGAVVFDMDSKTKCALGVKDYVEGESFDLATEIESVKSNYETVISKSYATEYNAKIDEITQAYADLKANFDTMSAELEKYKKADVDRKATEHKAEVDALIETYAKKIGRLPKFLCYRAKLDYSKETADIERELTVMAGEAMMDKGTASFSYSPVVAPVIKSASEKYAGSDRYGSLLDKYMND